MSHVSYCMINAIEEGDRWVDTVYMDMKKPFDRVPHKRLLWKLEHVEGLKGSVLKWMEDYLHAREMKTVIRDVGSSWGESIEWSTTGISAGTYYVSDIYK